MAVGGVFAEADVGDDDEVGCSLLEGADGALTEIPDGSWCSQIYHDHDGNENVMYPMCCRVVKEGDRLVIDLTGTSPQAPGSINCARPAMEGAVIGG